MTQPDNTNLPQTGAIIDFRYLLKKDQDRATEGAMPRPCLIWNVQAIESLHIVAVFPILSGAIGARVAINAAERAALGLDASSEVVFEEANIFLWAGPHIVPQPDGNLMRSTRASRQLLNAISSAMTGRNCGMVLRP
jgi:hypothetical protein